MGGYGTMFLAMKHPDILSSLSVHSGPIKVEYLDNSTIILFLQLDLKLEVNQDYRCIQ